MKKVIYLNKKEGETPLEALESFRAKHKEYKDLPMTYAGRLDPMASGLLVILAGEECKNKERYLNFDKEYEFEVLFGFATDTYDILGKIKHSYVLKNVGMSFNAREFEEKIKENLKLLKGSFIQTYPMYSSKTVDGRPLFVYAKSGESVVAPEREIHVKSLKFRNTRSIGSKKLIENIDKRIKKVKGDFRQEEIVKTWQRNLKDSGEKYIIGSFVVSCSSGTYVRSIANLLGGKMGIPALAYSIKRTRVGKVRLLG